LSQLSDAQASVQATFFSESSTLEEMFGQTEGALRQRMIFDVYLMDTVTIPWYSADGRPNIERHEINQRKNDTVRAAYVQSIAKNGLCDGVRGEPWMVAPQGWKIGNGGTFRAITFGTLTTAVYDAAKLPDAAENKYIQGTIEQGLPNCKILNPRTPRRVLQWLRDFHNSFHSGNSSTFTDEIQVALDVEAQWTAHRTSTNLTARSHGYNRLYAEFVMKHFAATFRSQQHFLSAKALGNELASDKRTALSMQQISNHTDYLDQKMPQSCLLIDLLHTLYGTMAKSFRHHRDKDLVNALVSTIAWGLVPKVVSKDLATLSNIPYCIQDTISCKTLFKLLAVEMTESKVYTAVKKKEEKKLLAGMTNSERFSAEMASPSGAMRKTLFIDDVLQMGTYICDNWYTAVSPELRIGMVEIIVAHIIEFIMTGKRALNGKTYHAWSTLRPVVSKLCTEWLRSQTGGGEDSVGQAILASISSAEQLEDDPVELHKKLTDDFTSESHDAFTGVRQMLDMYPTPPQLFLGDEYIACLSSLESMKDQSLPLAQIVQRISEVMFLPHNFVSLTHDALFITKSEAAKFGDPDCYLDRVFSNQHCLNHMGKMRAIITTRLLHDLFQSYNVSPQPHIDVRLLNDCFVQNIDFLAARDLCARGDNSWRNLWTGVLRCFAATQCIEDVSKFIDDDEPSPKRMKQEDEDEENGDDSLGGPTVVPPSDFSVNMSVAELNTGGTDEDPISTVALEMVRANIQQIAWECVNLAAAETETNLFDDISIDVKEKTLLPHISVLKQDFRLPFAGTVSWTKGKLSFMIGKFKNMPLYLNGDDHKDLTSYALSIPWCLPCARKGSPDHKKIDAATALNHPDGETVHVGFWDVTTSFHSTDFTVVHQMDGKIPDGCSELVLTFPFIKANPAYVDKENLPMRRRMTDHEVALNKRDLDSVRWAMGPQTTAPKRLAESKAARSARQQASASDKDIQKVARHILA
jgi:hypothetical protein